MAHNDPSRRSLEAQGQVRDGNKPKVDDSLEGKASVLHDSDGLREAALKASNGGKKRIVGLYLPDGNRIVMEDNRKEALAKAEAKAKAQSKKKKSSSLTGMTQKDFASEAARKRTNLSEVGHTYNDSRTYGQRRAAKNKRSEEEIDDDRAEVKATAILSKATDVEKGNYNDLFNFFDVDKDRTWGTIEFAQRMTDIGFPTGVEDAANLLYFAGVRDVDRITYNDFIEMMPKLIAFRKCIEKDAMRAFSEKDDGSGYISVKALRDLLEGLAGPEGADKDFVAAIVKKSDRLKTGRIPFDFFIRALFGSPPLMPYKRDMKTMSLQQKLLAMVGRCFGMDLQVDQSGEPGSEVDEDTIPTSEDFFDHAKHHSKEVAQRS